MARLKNQRELAQMAYFGGVNDDAGLDKEDGMET
jgi:hypothetical protein